VNNLTNDEFKEYTFEQEPMKSNQLPFPLIAGLLLILAGVLSIFLTSSLLMIDISTLEQFIDISQLQQINPLITIEDVQSLLSTCATIIIIISILPILGGIFCFKKKLWGICLACSIIGLITFWPSLIPGLLSLIALILIIISKKEFS
jgi:hypothetical protein